MFEQRLLVILGRVGLVASLVAASLGLFGLLFSSMWNLRVPHADWPRAEAFFGYLATFCDAYGLIMVVFGVAIAYPLAWWLSYNSLEN